ncbi:MAG TPA: ABC transporter ATP-binding protein [Spirochaetes bacterium]|nr:ABC transporter ATP-binding protein [Spirochaetota bacterium]
MNAATVKGLCHRYPDGRPGLNGVNLEVRAGSRTALVGRNGSGKTTLMLHLMGLLDGDGFIEIAGIERSRQSMKMIRKTIGYLPAMVEYHFIMPDLLNDVMLSLPEEMALVDKKNRAMQWLERFGLERYTGVSPLELSSGEMKRAALAGVLAREPELLLLDEPLGNLDRENSVELVSILKAQQCAMLFATHRRYLVEELADRVAVMEDGVIIGNYPKKEAMKRPEVKELLI